MRPSLIPLIVLFIWAAPAEAQHGHHEHSPYADERQSHIPSITAAEFAQIESGAGMGFAKPAELNHYPGPKHVLELADSLGLSDDQVSRVESIRQRMSDRAVELGRKYLHAEHELNQLFSNGKASEDAVVEQTARVGEAQASLRAVHLIAHVETRAVLTPDQIARYDALRGYVE